MRELTVVDVPVRSAYSLHAVNVTGNVGSRRRRAYRTLVEISWLSPCVDGPFSAQRGPGSDSPRSVGPEYAPCRNGRVPLGIDELDNFISITVHNVLVLKQLRVLIKLH